MFKVEIMKNYTRLLNYSKTFFQNPLMDLAMALSDKELGEIVDGLGRGDDIVMESEDLAKKVAPFLFFIGAKSVRVKRRAIAKEEAIAEGNCVREEITQKIFDLFEQYGCSVGAAEDVLSCVRQEISSTVPVKRGAYIFYD